MESTLDFEATQIPQPKQNKGFGLKNSQKQTYDGDFVRNFRGKAHTGSILQRPSWQGSVHDYERPLIIAKLQGFFKTNEHRCKKDRQQANH